MVTWKSRGCYFLTRLSPSLFLIMTLRMEVIQADRSSLLVVLHTENSIRLLKCKVMKAMTASEPHTTEEHDCYFRQIVLLEII